MAIKKSWKGTCFDPTKGYNKYYYLELRDDGSVYGRWGKVVEGCEDKDALKPLGHGEHVYDKKLREKMNQDPKKGTYKTVPVIDNISPVTAGRLANSNSSPDLLASAMNQIKFSSQDTKNLIELLVRSNIHNITTNTTITYNKKTGLFQTPLGVVNDSGLIQARACLNKIGDFVYLFENNRPLDMKAFDDAVMEYITLIPQDLGRITRFEPHTLFQSKDTVQKHDGILDSLAVSLDLVKNAPTDDQPVKVKEEQLFKVRLDLCEDKAEIERIRRFYQKTRQNIHAASRLDVARVFYVEIDHMREAFEAKGRPLGTVWELWHGTKIGNLLSIMKGGYYVPPASAPHVCGRMFGDGMYFSDQSTKSLNYAMGYAPGQRGGYESHTYMFTNDVAMGKYYTPQHSGGYRPPGYDSIFAQAGKSGVMNNEMIVPHTYQCCPTRLIEFK